MIAILITVQKYGLYNYCASISSTFFQNYFIQHVFGGRVVVPVTWLLLVVLTHIIKRGVLKTKF